MTNTKKNKIKKYVKEFSGFLNIDYMNGMIQAISLLEKLSEDEINELRDFLYDHSSDYYEEV